MKEPLVGTQPDRPGSRRLLECFLFIFLVISACGYRRGVHPESPLFDRPIAVPIFKNDTFEPILERRLTEIFKETFFARGWKVAGAGEPAPFVLSGRVNLFERTPITLGLQGEAREFRLKIGVEYALLQNGERMVVRQVEGVAEYAALPDPIADRTAQDRAIREAARRMAEEVADLLSEKNALAPPPPPQSAEPKSDETDPQRRGE